MAVHPEGRPATTKAHVLAWFDFLASLDLSLVTGRTHQIRVHLAHQGFPVFGDPVYEGRDRQLGRLAADERLLARRLLKAMPRQALHAWQLAFVHPITRKSLRFEAEVPDDLTHVLTLLGAGRTPPEGGERGDPPGSPPSTED
jgi:23S rRNA pseudouridine1911/1915/1917 synthase